MLRIFLLHYGLTCGFNRPPLYSQDAHLIWIFFLPRYCAAWCNALDRLLQIFACSRLYLELLLLLETVCHVRRRRRGVCTHRSIRVESVAVPDNFVLTDRMRLANSLRRYLKWTLTHRSSRERHYFFSIISVSGVTACPPVRKLLRVYSCSWLLCVAALWVSVLSTVIARLCLTFIQLRWLLVFLLTFLNIAKLS